jgi:GNAT superfamily N-acetyltransferase
MSLVLRPLTPHDFSSVDALLTAAYTPSTSMLDDLVRYHRLQPDGWVLALRDERPIGMGGALLYGACARIGLMAVLPEMQHQGIGVAILQHLLEWIAHRGAPRFSSMLPLKVCRFMQSLDLLSMTLLVHTHRDTLAHW